ncbi:hypothetical protein MUO32_24315 [Shinella sp. CPCC 101442]|uniref:hypothetical protein n=1 Tax=Shinella sp. CPCC 101442 TaxID=2932265 RepID=UPI0021524E35|nr:hypothetical protein [Shinella sp. CPCC 101442]MCR6502154.1 hypothetical protein [Shinella sp. CPCC 101442]
MNTCAVDLARLLAMTIEKMIHSEGQGPVCLSDNCVRVLAETIAAVDAGRVAMGEREVGRVIERKQDIILIPA